VGSAGVGSVRWRRMDQRNSSRTLEAAPSSRGDPVDANTSGQLRAFEAEVARLTALAPRWRSARTEPPTDGAWCVVVAAGRVCTAVYDASPFGGWSKPGVRWWQPFPEPPGEVTP
jgi:hypothetical protein